MEARITPRLIDSLYTEAMLLADEARAYFDEAGRDDRQTLEPFARVGFACELLKVTTRIMHIVAWLLTQKAVESGEIRSPDGRRPERRLGHANDSDPLVVAQLPEAAAAADQCQRRPLFADQAARRRPDGRRAGAKPGAGPDGAAGARPDLEPRPLSRLGSLHHAALYLQSRTKADLRRRQRRPACRAVSAPARACSSPTRTCLRLGLTDSCRAALKQSGREVVSVRCGRGRSVEGNAAGRSRSRAAS